ncbi:MAG: histidine kinase [Candidatus Caccosoma sp.]|nr:histidine kinase [Candidatus Caccosoma sp.]
MKKTFNFIINKLLIIILLFLVSFLIVFGTIKSKQATKHNPIRVQYDFVYSLDEELYKPLAANQTFYGEQLCLKGKLINPITKEASFTNNERIHFILNHLTVTIYINGVEKYKESSDSNNLNSLSSVCGTKYVSFDAFKVNAEDVLEIHLKKSHPIGSSYAFNDFLNNIYISDDITFEAYITQKGLPLSMLGYFTIIISFIVLGIGLGFIKKNKEVFNRLFSWGKFSIFVGLFLFCDVSHYFLGIHKVSFQTYCWISFLLLAAYEMINCIENSLDGVIKKITKIVKISFLLIIIISLLLVALEIIGIYNILLIFVPLMIVTILFLLVCCISTILYGNSSYLHYFFIVFLFASEIELFNLIFGFVKLGVIIKPTFLILFLVYLLSELRNLVINQQRIEEAKSLENELKNSRASLAISQIRSHFIFNVLNAISGLCKYDPIKADEMIICFSRYLRNNIDFINDDSLVPFSSEITHLNDYIKLEQMRFTNKIRFDCENNINDFLIPPLILQPLVENSIKHGLLKKAGGGCISLNITKEGEYVAIVLKDDGIGFDTSKARNVNSIGIENVRFRLKNSINGMLDIESTINKGTTIIIVFPYMEVKNENNLH